MKVMIVEDYADTRQIVKLMLEMKGCQVVEAENGSEAIIFAKRGDLNLILMDLNLPVLDGFQATRQICVHRQSRHIPVIAISAQRDAAYRQAALAAGCRGFIGKPIDFEKLDTVISHHALKKQKC